MVIILQKIHDVLDADGTHASTHCFQVFLATLIILNVVFTILDTEQSVHETYGPFLALFKSMSLGIFTVEYALRLISYRKRGDTRRFALARLVVSPLMLVDLIVILPIFVPLFVSASDSDVALIHILRSLRLFSIFKLARISRSMRDMGLVMRKSAPDLGLAYFILFIVLILASSMMYYAEREAQPQIFSSIPASMWWGVVTLTTVGYGDTYPITVLGRSIAAVIALLGIAIYALPTGIVASAFVSYRRSNTKKDKNNYCKHCGKRLD